MSKIKSFNEFVNEEDLYLNEESSSDINLSHAYMMVMFGGSIGDTSKKHRVMIASKGSGIIKYTGDDKEFLKDKAKSYNKMLSPGEKKYYGIIYSVFPITPSIIKQIEQLNKVQDIDVPEA